MVSLLRPSEAWVEGGRAEKVRASLRRNGWENWTEEHIRGVVDSHTVNVYSEAHERGPLIEWVHPAECACLNDSVAAKQQFPLMMRHPPGAACLKGEHHEIPCNPSVAEQCRLEHRHGRDMPCLV